MTSPASPQTCPRIRILATGGTIAGVQTTDASRSYLPGAFSISALIAAVPQLTSLAELEVEPVAAMGSQDMDERVWMKLADRVRVALADPTITGVVITHGTDTMEETAFFLNLVVASTKPIVLVGAMRPATAISADGPMNLFNAIAVAAHPEACGRGVLVVANDEIHFAREVTKTNTTQVGTFRATHRGLAGLVNAGRLHLYAPPVRRHTTASEFGDVPAVSELPRVDIVYAYAGMRRDSIDTVVKCGARGLVIAGVGDGNLNSESLTAAAAAAKNGVAVVRSSRTGGGVVERNIEVDDDALGFVAADELNPQKARVLLMLALTRTRDPAELQRVFFTY
ncbi:MAG: asparaginase [Opitutus sp.]